VQNEAQTRTLLLRPYFSNIKHHYRPVLEEGLSLPAKWTQPEFGLEAIPEEHSGRNLRLVTMALTTVENSVEFHLCVQPRPLMLRYVR